jgi:hypothetical protein
LRRFNVFVLGVVLGAAFLWISAYVGMLGFSSVEGAAFSALLLFALVVVDMVLGGFLARMLLHDGSFSRRETKGIGLLAGGSLFTGAFVSGLFLGVMILLNTASSHRTLFVFATGPGLGLVYGMVLGVPAVVGATLVELRFYSRRSGGPPG